MLCTDTKLLSANKPRHNCKATPSCEVIYQDMYLRCALFVGHLAGHILGT